MRVILRFGLPGRRNGAPGVLLVAPPPIIEVGCLAGMFAGGAAKSRALAAEVQAAAERVGVPFLDAGSVVRVSPIDGIHYDAEANPALAEAFAAAITAHFPGLNWSAYFCFDRARVGARLARTGGPPMTQHDPPRLPSPSLRANVAVPFERARAMPKSVYTSPDFAEAERRAHLRAGMAVRGAGRRVAEPRRLSDDGRSPASR